MGFLSVAAKAASAIAAAAMLSGGLMYLRYSRSQFPRFRDAKRRLDFSSFLLSYAARPLVRRFFTISESDWDRDRPVAGLKNVVDVYRDEKGIPYIFAHTDADAHYAHLYVEYTERPFQFELLRRVAAGRLSETFGRNTLPTDIRSRAIVDRDYLQYRLDTMAPEVKAMIDNAASAINEAGSALPATPVEFYLLKWKFEPWTPLDYLMVVQLLALHLSKGFTVDFTRAALHRGMGDYWQAFDLGTARGVHPRKFSGERPVLPTQHRRRMQSTLMGPGESEWASLRPDHVRTVIETLRRRQETTAGGADEDSEPVKEGPVDWEEETTSADTETAGAFGRLGAGSAGSNAWAVSGLYTSTGSPILAVDMHMPAFCPGFWMPVFISVGPSPLLSSAGGTGRGRGGSWRRPKQSRPRHRVTGVSAVGLARVFSGHNEHSAWGQILSYAKFSDLYLVRLDSARRRYYYDNDWHILRVRHETFTVKGDSRGKTATLRYTHHGPIISDFFPAFKQLLEPDEALVLATVAGRAPLALPSLIFLENARTWEDFVLLGTLNQQLGLTAVWATSEGDIGRTLLGALPRREPPHTKHGIRDGTSSGADWQGVLPQNQTPKVAPDWCVWPTADESGDPKEFPVSVFLPGYRQRRVHELLRGLISRGNIEVNDMIEMQHDVVSRHAQEWRAFALSSFLWAYNRQQISDRKARVIRRVCQEEGLLPGDGEWLYKLMRRWDGSMDGDSIAATVYEVWQQWTLQLLFEMHGFSDKTLEILQGVEMDAVWFPASDMRHHWKHNLLHAMQDNAAVIHDVTTPNALLCGGAAAALEWLLLRYGKDTKDWAWGRVRTRFIDHPLSANLPVMRHTASIGPYQLGGNDATINSHHFVPKILDSNNPRNGAFSTATDTTVFRMVVDLSDMRNSFWAVLPGVSGWVGSKNYGNFASAIETTAKDKHRNMRRMLWTDEDIQGAAVTHMRLLPVPIGEGGSGGERNAGTL